MSASYQRIDGHSLIIVLTADNNPCCFVAKNKGSHSTFIMAEIGMHIGTTNPDGIYPHQNFTLSRCGVFLLAVDDLLRCGVDKCFHLFISSWRYIHRRREWPGP